MKQRAGARALALFFSPGQSGAWCAPPGYRVPGHFCARPRWLAATRIFPVWRAVQLDVAWEWRQNSNEQPQLEARSPPASSLVGRDCRRLGVALTWRRRRLCAPLWPALLRVSCQAAEGTLEDRTTRVKPKSSLFILRALWSAAGLQRATLSRARYPAPAWAPSQAQHPTPTHVPTRYQTLYCHNLEKLNIPFHRGGSRSKAASWPKVT